MLKIIICDNDTAHNSFIQQCVIEEVREKGINAKIELISEDPKLVLDYVSSQNNRNEKYINAYVFNIQIGQNSHRGIRLGKEIREIDKIGYLLYLASNADYANDCLKLNTYRYLIKPVSREDLAETLSSLWEDYCVNYSIED